MNPQAYSKQRTIMLILLSVLALVVIMVAGVFNRFVALKNRYLNAFAQIDVQLKRRHDLIPNLVETAQGYMKHERETLEAVIRARSMASDIGKQVAGNLDNPALLSQLASAEGMLGQALGRLFALSEAYPELKADTSMLELQEEIASTENRIAFARQAYNDSVMMFNTFRESFPQNMLAPMFGFLPATMFEITDEAVREAPRVDFGS